MFDANDADSWTGLARALLAIKPDQGSERYELPVNASGAAWNAYERAHTPAAKAAALVVLHEALKRRSYWRPAIDALKASLTLVEDAQVREAYDKLVAEHGFRIVEYKVEADAALPRLCIQFSERLAPGQVDWSQYFKVDGKDPQSVTAEARQICLDGLAHGKRYEVQVREGLPSAIGEKLAKTAELAVYVKDRAPSVRATGRGYVLPNRGQQGIPLVTVNTDKVNVEVYRIGDRSLAQTLQGGDFAKQISSYDISHAQGAHRRPGLCRRAGRGDAPQRGRDHRLPHRRGHPQAAARRLRAGRLRRRPRRRTRAIAAPPRSGSSSPTSASPPSTATTACTPSCARSPPPRRWSTPTCA